MRRPKLSNEQRERMLEHLEKQIILKERRKRLYNKRFRKSSLFIFAWTIRCFYIIAFFTIAFIHFKPTSQSEEVLLSKKIERYQNNSSRNGAGNTTSILYMVTNLGEYTANISGLSIPGFSVGDTMIIQKNIFNKPILFTKQNWLFSYSLTVHFAYYFIILFLTLISFFFNDGLDKSILKILWGFIILDLSAILFYFFS